MPDLQRFQMSFMLQIKAELTPFSLPACSAEVTSFNSFLNDIEHIVEGTKLFM